MLRKIYCEKFKTQVVNFHSGLNVILGEERANNSIGKTSMLMAIDYAYGGSAYAKQSVLIENVGHHEMRFVFEFNGKEYNFIRHTDKPCSISVCDEAWNVCKIITDDDYCNFLKSMYQCKDNLLSFREMVSPFSRVYGKNNYDELKPLHSYPNDKGEDIITRILKLFCVYDRVQEQLAKLQINKDRIAAIKNVDKLDLIKVLQKKTETENLDSKIAAKNREIKNIAEQLASQTVDLSNEKRKVLTELNDELILLQQSKAALSSQINRLSRDSYNSEIKINNSILRDLGKFFPKINFQSVSEVYTFHEKLSTILKEEIKEQINRKKGQLAVILEQESKIIGKIAAVSLEDNPARLAIKRMLETQKSIDELLPIQIISKERENLIKEKTILKKNAEETLVKLLTEIEQRINETIKKDNGSVSNGLEAPMISLDSKNYKFFTPNDTGAGTNFIGLLLLDVALLSLTQLPILIHDSNLFKNVSFERMDNLVKLYSGFIEKQVFIATDALSVYSKDVKDIIKSNIVLQLEKNGGELFGKSWSRLNS